jgi:hypothetical protein
LQRFGPVEPVRRHELGQTFFAEAFTEGQALGRRHLGEALALFMP